MSQKKPNPFNYLVRIENIPCRAFIKKHEDGKEEIFVHSRDVGSIFLIKMQNAYFACENVISSHVRYINYQHAVLWAGRYNDKEKAILEEVIEFRRNDYHKQGKFKLPYATIPPKDPNVEKSFNMSLFNFIITEKRKRKREVNYQEDEELTSDERPQKKLGDVDDDKIYEPKGFFDQVNFKGKIVYRYSWVRTIFKFPKEKNIPLIRLRVKGAAVPAHHIDRQTLQSLLDKYQVPKTHQGYIEFLKEEPKKIILDLNLEEDEPEQIPYPIKHEIPIPKTGKFCENCGTQKITQTAKFCRNCGNLYV